VGADGKRPHSVTAAVSAYAVHIYFLTAGTLNEVSREDRSRLKRVREKRERSLYEKETVWSGTAGVCTGNGSGRVQPAHGGRWRRWRWNTGGRRQSKNHYNNWLYCKKQRRAKHNRLLGIVFAFSIGSTYKMASCCVCSPQKKRSDHHVSIGSLGLP
jgi:hypothetical protein